MTIRSSPCAVIALAAGFLTSSAYGAEVQFDGFYWARGRVFDSLSLSNDLSNAEGRAIGVEQLLFLRPRFIVNDNVALFVDFRGLDHVGWGDQPAYFTDPATGLDVDPSFGDSINSPTSTTDAGDVLTDFTVWHAWGEVYSPKLGRFKVGRMPLNWGMGIWQNDGLGYNADFGDTADRIQWERLFDVVYVSLAIDINANEFVNQTDQTMSYNIAGAYRSETIKGGVNLQYRRNGNPKFQLFTVDLALEAALGNLKLEAEGIGQFGSGDLANGQEDANVTTFGAVVDLSYQFNDKFGIALQGGFASGDKDVETDLKIRTFTFDRDFNVGLVMFEQPLPTLAAAAANDDNANRDLDSVLSYNAVSNAMYLRPTVHYKLVKGLTAEATFVAARMAKVPASFGERKSYGMEFDLGLTYEAFDHIKVTATGAVFLPGSYYKEFEDDDYPSGTFDRTVWAGQLYTEIRF